jgi:tetratricopeptide (TPR) repeat protein
MVSVLLMMMAVSAFGAGSSSGGGSGGSGGSGGGSGMGSSRNPVTATQWYDNGYQLSQSAKYDDAIVSFKKAIALNANYAEAYNMLGFCTRKLGNTADAFTFYDKALALKPNFPEAREYYGEAYLQAGDLTKAIQQYVILEKAGSKYAKDLFEDIDAYVNK